MINMNYQTWFIVCSSFLYQKKNILNKYLQWYPISLLSDEDKSFIKSEKFFDKFIKNNAIFADPSIYTISKRFIQKSNASFRVTRLISPILYLYILAIGKQTCEEFVSHRKTTRCYYSGILEDNIFYYKDAYDKFFADINESQDMYDYYMKVDLTNFFDCIDINRLFTLVNREKEILDARTTLIYRNILSMIGNGKYPIIENNVGLSYLATVVYLESFDIDIEEYLSDNPDIEGFQLIRYVDDLYIFFSCEKSRIYKVESDLKNKLISLSAMLEIQLNDRKQKIGNTTNIMDDLKSNLYDFYFNGEELRFGDYYNIGDLIDFFDRLTKIQDSHTHASFQDAMKKSFVKDGVHYSEQEVMNCFLFYKSDFFQKDEVKSKISKLIEKDYRIFKYNIKGMIMSICHTRDGRIIRNLLSKIFLKCRTEKIDVFDESMIVEYLLNRGFMHEHLKFLLRTMNSEVAGFINENCLSSFVPLFNERILYKSKVDGYHELYNDELLWFQYFMYKYNEILNRQLESFAYLKVFFDRMIAHVMNIKGVETCGGKNKPNFKKYYKEKSTLFDIQTLGIRGIDGQSIEDILKKASTLRNENPINHSSAAILNKTDISIGDINKTKLGLIRLINKCLN